MQMYKFGKPLRVAESVVDALGIFAGYEAWREYQIYRDEGGTDSIFQTMIDGYTVWVSEEQESIRVLFPEDFL